MEKPDEQIILDFFRDVSYRMGNVQLEMQDKIKLMLKDEGIDNVKDVVTEADFLCQETFLRGAIEQGFNRFGILAEEKTGFLDKFSKTSRYTLVVDPVDGTANYAKNREEFGVSLGFMEDSEFLVGLIYIPKRKLMFDAIKGKGAYCTDLSGKEPVTSRCVATAPDKVKAMDLGYKVSAAVAEKLEMNGVKTRVPVCAVYSIGCILLHEINAFYNMGAYIWDIGPGVQILCEAGHSFTAPFKSWSMKDERTPFCFMYDSEFTKKEIERMIRPNSPYSIEGMVR